MYIFTLPYKKMAQIRNYPGGFVIVLIVISSCSCAPQNSKNKETEDWRPEVKDSILESTLVRYYVFAIQNADEFDDGGIPDMKEIGPFTYTEKRVKTNFNRLQGNGSSDNLQYDVHWSMHFLPELTGEGLTQKTEYTGINVPFITMAQGLAIVGLPKAFNDILIDEVVEAGEKLYREKMNFGDGMFYGYNVSLYTEILDDVTQGQTEERYPELAGGKFAFYKGKNDTVIGRYTVESTRDNPLGKIVTFNDSPELGFYPENSECDRVANAYDFFALPRNIKKDSVLTVFLPENCRTLKMTYVQEDVYREVPVYVFKFPLEQFSNDKTNPETNCYCLNLVNVSDPQCLDYGLMDYSGCGKGAPLVGSFPHFLDANPRHLKNVKGLMPNRSLHESEVMIEPITGTPLYAVRRFQVNLRMKSIETVTQFENVTERIIPMAWFEHILEVPSAVFTEVKEKLEMLKQVKSDKDIYQHDQNPAQEVDDNTILGVEFRGGPLESSSLESNKESHLVNENDVNQTLTVNSASSLSNGAFTIVTFSSLFLGGIVPFLRFAP